jgi:hypothetical protein
MTENQRMLQAKLRHLSRMSEYLAFSHGQVTPLLVKPDWAALTAEEHESLAAFRVRFSEFQEHLGKAMRSVAIEEEVDVDRFGSVLAFMERLRVIDSVDQWKLIRELRNAVNHEYEDNEHRLREFFTAMAAQTPVLQGCLERLVAFSRQAYPQAFGEPK